MTDELERLSQALAGRYRLDSELGRGGMATVYRAHDLRHGRAVAVKVFDSAVAAALGRERFLREIAVTAALDHPHILPLLDSGEAAGFLYYVMPCVEGETLRRRLRREPQLPLHEALAITREIADALEHAHRLGIIHRDVKPENILLAGGHARLADFGIAQTYARTGGNSLTQTGLAVGTALYMSPEQASGRPLDGRTDIYSLACVAFEMIAGQPPALATGGEADGLDDHAPAGIADAIRRALASSPAERFSTARDFGAALEGSRSGSEPRQVGTMAGPHARSPLRASTTVALPRPRRRPPAERLVVMGVLAALIGTAAVWWLSRHADSRWLAREALPRIEEYLNTADYESAWRLAREIEKRIPDSPELAELWPRISWRVTIPSEPPGARVSRQSYAATDEVWEELGRTPLTGIRFPYGLSRIRLELEGHRPLLRAMGGAHFNWAELGEGNPDGLLVGPETFRLDPEEVLPRGMVRVPGGMFVVRGSRLKAEDFFIGRHEVTNAEYKTFVDAGGYQRRELWEPIIVDGAAVRWEDGIRLFVDRTGRPGPSTWEAGHYPHGYDHFPVSGVSWYEASAYARFAGRELPTAHHWQQALANAMFPWLLPVSNFDGQGPRAITDSRSMTHVGAFDLTGNVREWTATALGHERLVLGGSWADPYYIVGTDDTAAPPLDRSAGNGIRLALTRDPADVAARLRLPFETRSTAAPTAPPPVTDAVYAAYSRVFDYGDPPLNAAIESLDRARLWRRERVRITAGYGSEQLPLDLYVPVSGSPPYQVVVYWPGWDTFALSDIEEYFVKQVDFLVKSGRVVAFPVYKGTFERRLDSARRPPFDTVEYRDNAIETVKELRRTIDYLQTRVDIDLQRIAFFGYSWGGVNGPTALAQDPRLKAAVINIGVLPKMSSTPEVDPVNALPRVRQPTLLLSGEFDAMVPVENAKRYFALLGTPPADKRHVVVIGGHFIPRDVLIRETLDWLDRYLGEARR